MLASTRCVNPRPAWDSQFGFADTAQQDTDVGIAKARGAVYSFQRARKSAARGQWTNSVSEQQTSAQRRGHPKDVPTYIKSHKAKGAQHLRLNAQAPKSQRVKRSASHTRTLRRGHSLTARRGSLPKTCLALASGPHSLSVLKLFLHKEAPLNST